MADDGVLLAGFAVFTAGAGASSGFFSELAAASAASLDLPTSVDSVELLLAPASADSSLGFSAAAAGAWTGAAGFYSAAGSSAGAGAAAAGSGF